MSNSKVVSFRTQSEEDELGIDIIEEISEETSYDKSHIIRYQLDKKISRAKTNYEPVHEHDDNLEELIEEKREEYSEKISSLKETRTDYGFLANAAAAAHRKAEKADFDRSDEIASNAEAHIKHEFPESPYARVLSEESSDDHN